MEPAGEPERDGTLSAALADTAALLGTSPELAGARAAELLRTFPAQQQGLLLAVCARRVLGDSNGARAVLEEMTRAMPGLAAAHFELGLLLGGLGEVQGAVAALSRTVELEPEHPSAWRALGRQLAKAGDKAGAARAFAKQAHISLKELRMLEQAATQDDSHLAPAESMLREFVKVHLTDAFATHMLARIGTRLGRHEDAEALYAKAVELAPKFNTARYDYALCLQEQRKWEPLGEQADRLLARDPHDPSFRVLKAEALTMLGEYAEAIRHYEALLADLPEDSFLWAGYGHVLRTVGRTDDSIAAYRKSVALEPGLGRAWWSLANLKTYRFETAEVETMETQFARCELAEAERIPLHFALGKAFEDRGDYSRSFEQYRRGNTLQRAYDRRSGDLLTGYLRTSREMLTPGFFRERAGSGCPAPDPIFVVGLPRSGSTLIEQILSSHSAIEGTTELPDLTHIVVRLNGGAGKYPAILEKLRRDELKALGEEYLHRTRVHRKLGRPFFIDKLPNNFEHVALIHLILPNAKIIDTRRHPLACCVSNFRHHFENPLTHSCDLGELGRYYRDYVELMTHFDSVLPGRIHRVCYENMVRDPESEIHRVLAYCGVAFEPACLRFHETARGVRTASSEQVRRPVYADAVEQWRRFEPWLDPLKSALGPLVDRYPDVLLTSRTPTHATA